MLIPLAKLIEFVDVPTIQRWVEAGGYYVIFGLLFACGLGLPLPEDIPLIIGGYFSATGHLHLAMMSFLAWCGIIGGDIVLYHLGKRYGLNITRVPLVGKHVTRERIERAERLFERYGIWVVAVGRLFAGVRGAMVVAAGATRFNFIKFVIADGVAALLSGGLFVALGWWAGRKLGDLEELAQRVGHYETYVLIGILVLVIGLSGYFWWRRVRRKRTLGGVVLERVEETIEQDPAIPTSQSKEA